jgi:hypothetical protein
MSLLQWAERQFKVVEQNGTHVSLIKLITPHDGEVWETWQAPFGEPDAWVTHVEELLRSLEGQWPSRAVPVVFMASSAQGEVLAKYPHTVTGKNKSNVSPWSAEQAALSMMVDNFALSLEKVCRLVNTQLDGARKMNESANVTIFNQTEYIKLLLNRDAMQQSESGSDPLSKLVAERGSDFVDIAKMLAMNYAKKSSGANGAS